jgi:endo-1,4-beta-mannosidase
MPSFTMYRVEVDVDVDIDVDEFLDNCSERDIKTVIRWLKDNDYLGGNNANIPGSSTDNVMEITYKNALSKLYNKRVNLSLEEEEFLINLANKF